MSTKRGKLILIAIIGSAIGLSILLLVTAELVADGWGGSCPSEGKKCEDENHLYHLPSKQCLKNGESHGRICGGNMVISPLTACRIQGGCECDYERSDERHLVYDEGTHQCYPFYSQGPCEDGYVVSVSSNGRGLKCKRDTCSEEKTAALSSGVERESIVPFKNQCYTLFTKLDEPGCHGELKFWTDQLHPSRSPPPRHSPILTEFAPLKCPYGSRRALLELCQPARNFKFLRWNHLDTTLDSDE